MYGHDEALPQRLLGSAWMQTNYHRLSTMISQIGGGNYQIINHLR